MTFAKYEKTKSPKSSLKFHVSCPNFTLSEAFHFSPKHWLFSSFPISSFPTISFSSDFVFPDYLISAQIHCPNLSPDFSSRSVVSLSIPIGVALRADRCWIFEVSRFSKSRPKFDFLSESQCFILYLDSKKMFENVRRLKFSSLCELLLFGRPLCI